jgi:hypothetical protein
MAHAYVGICGSTAISIEKYAIAEEFVSIVTW